MGWSAPDIHEQGRLDYKREDYTGFHPGGRDIRADFRVIPDGFPPTERHHQSVTTQQFQNGPARPLRRSRSRVIAGVSAGLADYFGAPVWLFRALFLLAVITGGAGLPLYIVLWLIVPEVGTRPGVLDRWLRPRS